MTHWREEHAMVKRREIAAAIAAAGLVTPSAKAQTAQDIVGAWVLVSSVAEQGGAKVDTYGPKPKGRLLFGSDGRYTLIFVGDVPKFASNNRASGTAEENRAVVQGSIAHFGTYSLDDAGKTLVLRIESSTFPNWDGVEQRRPFTLTGDELAYTSPGPLGPTRITLRRVK
jgi:hypothetical protein